MKFYKNYVKALIVMLVFTLMLGGCATLKRLSTEEKITAAYVTAGESMIAIHGTWKELRESGKVNDEQNAKFNSLFTKAKETYLLMGTFEIAALTAVDTASKQGAIAAFNEAANKLPELLLEIQALIKLVKGGK
jgi:hypothetical protein